MKNVHKISKNATVKRIATYVYTFFMRSRSVVGFSSPGTGGLFGSLGPS